MSLYREVNNNWICATKNCYSYIRVHMYMYPRTAKILWQRINVRSLYIAITAASIYSDIYCNSEPDILPKKQTRCQTNGFHYLHNDSWGWRNSSSSLWSRATTSCKLILWANEITCWHHSALPFNNSCRHTYIAQLRGERNGNAI